MDMELRTVLIAVHGSQAYGFATKDSDLDFKGIALPSFSTVLSFSKHFEQWEDSKAIVEAFPILKSQPGADKKAEGIIYNLSKFMALAIKCNPNIIELLYVNPEHILLLDPILQPLFDKRDLFLSAAAKHTFSGYAAAQLKRIQGHRRWLLNPINHEPKREEFGLGAAPSLKKEQIEAGIWATDQKIDMNLSAEVMEIINREKAFATAHREWEQYKNWERTRNLERAKLETQFGYDCKHAAHLVRLLRMGREILVDGKVLVDRRKAGDADELLSIRGGSWSYDKLIAWAEDEDRKLTEIYDSKKYSIPHHPNLEKLEEIYQMIIWEHIADPFCRMCPGFGIE